MRLTIIRIKPNPAGKDRPPHGGPSPSQLAGEWVDFRSDAGKDVPLDHISLWPTNSATRSGTRRRTR